MARSAQKRIVFSRSSTRDTQKRYQARNCRPGVYSESKRTTTADITLAELLEDRPPVIVTHADVPVMDAMERMIEHDYSQLPVTDDKGRLLGMLTMTGIACASLHLDLQPGQLRVQHVLNRHPTTAEPEMTLWRALDKAKQARALCIVAGKEKELKGILTDYDFTAYLRHLSEDSTALADIEESVKHLIHRNYEEREDDLKQAIIQQVRGTQGSAKKRVKQVLWNYLTRTTGRPAAQVDKVAFGSAFDEFFIGDISADFDGLSFGQYSQILLSNDVWTNFRETLDLTAESMRVLLRDARGLRNRLAHHRGSLTAIERDRLIFCRGLLNKLADQDGIDGDATESEIDDAVDTYEAAFEDGHGAIFAGLARNLESLEKDRAAFRFDTIDRMIEGALPGEAHDHRSWWRNDEETPQAKAWLDAGWRVVKVNMTKETATFARNTQRNEAYIAAFNNFYAELNNAGWQEDTPSPAGHSWQCISRLPVEGVSTAQFILAFARGKKFRIELYIDGGNKASNEAAFDALRRHAAQIEDAASHAVAWERLEARRASRVAVYYPTLISIVDSDEQLRQLVQWVAEVAPPLYLVFQEHYSSHIATDGRGLARESGEVEGLISTPAIA